MQFIDTHTHNSDPAFEGEEDLVIRAALDAGVCKMLQADVDSRERGRMFDLVNKYPGILYPMLGLYPGSVGTDWREEVEELSKWRSKGVVAIGEIGLDYHYSRETADLQKEALAAQFELAAQWNLPVNIHLREATEDFFDVLEAHKSLGLRGNLHAFSGSYETFKRIQKYGDWRIGVGGVVTFKKAGLAEVVGKVPLERILLETDSPYLTPVPFRGTRNDSSKIPIIAAKIAEIKGIGTEDVAAVTTANASELFNI